MPRNIVGSRLTTLEEATTRAAAMPEAQWPEPRMLDRTGARRTDFQEEIDALRGECGRIARELGIAASTLAPRVALEAIARSQPGTLDEIMDKGNLLRWQAELVQGAVEKHLRSTKGEKPDGSQRPYHRQP